MNFWDKVTGFFTGRNKRSKFNIHGKSASSGNWLAGESIPQDEEVRAAVWKFGSEAQASAQLPVTPESFPDGRLRFDRDFALAHHTQTLRSRLFVQVSDQVREHGENLAVAANDIAQNLTHVKAADKEAAEAINRWRKVHDDVQADEIEFARYSRARNIFSHYVVKSALFFLFFLAEIALTWSLFQSLFGGDHASPEKRVFAGLISLGIVVILVAIPHYSAIQLKNSLTKRHKHEVDTYEHFGIEPTTDLKRKSAFEKVEDRYGIVIMGFALLLMIILIFPLAQLRGTEFSSSPKAEADKALVKAKGEFEAADAQLASATEKLASLENSSDTEARDAAVGKLDLAKIDRAKAQAELEVAQLEKERIEKENKGGRWLIFFLFFQVLISTLFFLLEWISYGTDSRHLLDLDAEKKKALLAYKKAVKGLRKAMKRFDGEAQLQAHVVRSAPQYDQQLVEHFNKEVRELREIYRREHPDLQAFLHFAAVPTLPVDSTDPVGTSESYGYFQIPIAIENPSLDDDDDYDVRYSIKRALASIVERNGPEILDHDGDSKISDEWLMISNPYLMLEQVLESYGFEKPYYARSAALEEIVDYEPDPVDEFLNKNREIALKKLEEALESPASDESTSDEL